MYYQMRMENDAGSSRDDRRPGGSRVAGDDFRQTVDAHRTNTASRAEGLPEFARPNAADETTPRIQPRVGFSEASSQRSASGLEVENDGLWDVFLADDLDDEPQPERGDFWLDGP